ncbi:MAG: VWA domain-containing protein [Caldisphaeraceae archaeon]|nr:VWA domain-containing protein [Caldisphaeraceae archaeon]
MKFIGEGVLIGIDTSISMLRRDFRPNRLENAKRAASIISRELMSRSMHTLISVLIFYRYSFPLTDLTDKLNVIEDIISQIKIMGKATAPSNAIKDAYLILRSVPPGYYKRIILITDGGFNEGVDIVTSATLLAKSNIELDVLAFSPIPRKVRDMIDEATRMTNGVWFESTSIEEFFGNASKLGERYPE